jgi:NAD(P)-dependent dehydrogenase (short-subunit alcohol dehydrogenase family)
VSIADPTIDTLAEVMRRHRAGTDELRDRVIAITGAGDGIGNAVAAAAAHGASRADRARCGGWKPPRRHRGAGRAATRAARPGAGAGGRLRPICRHSRRYRRLDGLLHNAAILGRWPDRALTCPPGCVCCVNVTAAMALTQCCCRCCVTPPWCTSSGVTQHAPYWGAYVASKHAVEGLADTLAAELAGGERAVRVNVIDPGATRTRMRRQAYPAEEQQRLTPPEALAGCYLWLLGPASRGVTGRRLRCQ